MKTTESFVSGSKSSPLDWLKKNLNVPAEVARQRLDICHACEEFRPVSRLCKVCHCFMPGKVHINMANCPKGKWTRHQNPGAVAETAKVEAAKEATTPSAKE